MYPYLVRLAYRNRHDPYRDETYTMVTLLAPTRRLAAQLAKRLYNPTYRVAHVFPR